MRSCRESATTRSAIFCIPTGSVFCAHGAGFEVKWDEVDRMAHLPLLDFAPKKEEAPKRIVRSVAPGGAPELEKELLADFRADVWAN